MLNTGVIIAAGVVWLALLFGVALYGERHTHVFERRWAIVYALSLAVHCTSWTFYGTVTQLGRSGWWLPPTFIGAILLFIFGVGILVRMARLAREHNASSLADLIAARLGRHSGLAALVTAVMLLGIVPYIALQLKAVAMSYGMLVRNPQGMPAWHDSALYIALLMALFAMLFGTRRASAVAHNRGLVLAMAFESLFKLVAMLALGSLLFSAPEAWTATAPEPGSTSGFPSLILLGAFAMFTLPHQFHVGIVECRDTRHLKTARWLFPLYMLLIAAPALPLARLGDARLAASGVPSDLYMLALPLAQGKFGLALLAFLGGLSAATSMVVVATLALSLMIANHFIAPLRVRAGWGRSASGDLRGEVLVQRRLAILAVVLLAWIYSRILVGNDELADIGALSFSALAGLAPAALVAVYWPRLGARPVTAGLAAGTLVWLYTLFPGVFTPNAAWLTNGPFGIAPLAPADLLGLGAWSALARAVTLSLTANLLVLLLVAYFDRGRRDTKTSARELEARELEAVAMRFLPPERVTALFADTPRNGRIDAMTLSVVEHELAAVIGASSARLLLDVAHRDRLGHLDTVAAIVGEASQDLRFNQRVLEAALENMSQGICVVDADLRVVAWNRRYAELFNYPQGILAVGRPVAELTRYSITSGVIGAGDVEARVQQRLAHMRSGTAHLSERRFPDGSVIEIRGNPMPGGGYVATFSDVTAFRHAERALTRANETLEQRVVARTAELARATGEAERANETKSRFLAAVSHDLLQPLHAAQLFAHSLSTRLLESERPTARHLDGALNATESLLAGLLDIARLDGGRLHPRARAFALDELLGPLTAEFAVLAEERGLRLDAVRTRVWVRSDPQLLRRVLQNFLGNALRHAERGRVLLGCRRDGQQIRVEVWDTGPGIAESERHLIFEEFRRGGGATGQGLGLGLAIAERMARLLNHALSLRSWPGCGSAFAVTVPLTTAEATATLVPAQALPESDRGGVALVVDNEPQALTALRMLLESWGWRVLAARDAAQALSMAAAERPDVAILDYHLDGGHTGLALHAELRAVLGDLRTAILTADRDSALRQRVQAEGIVLLYKPLKPLMLQQLLRQAQTAAAARTESQEAAQNW
jgi:Na+/proline symporter/CheY-like chemotaxis protein